eukprot:CFRG1023T1
MSVLSMITLLLGSAALASGLVVPETIATENTELMGQISLAQHLTRPHSRQRREAAQTSKRMEYMGNDEAVIAEIVSRNRRRPVTNITEGITSSFTTLGNLRAKYVSIEWIEGKKDKHGVPAENVLVVVDLDGSSKTELWRSVDNGKTFKEESEKVKGEMLDGNSVLKSPYFENRVVLLGGGKDKLFTTIDGGETWVSSPLNIQIDPTEVYFHPTDPDKLLVLAGSDHSLHVTTDFCKTFSEPHAKMVLAVDWGPADKQNESSVFWTEKRKSGKRRVNVPIGFDLYRSLDLFKTRSKIQQDGFDFAILDKFLFITTANGAKKTMEMKVSEDGGDTWNHAHFPVDLEAKDIAGQERTEMGYQILDASEGSVFINVDNDNDNTKAGRGLHTGNLYTSDASGTAYALSLSDNLYLQSLRNDFHKVESILGTYITNQLVVENYVQEFRTVITFDKGGEWKPIVAPQVDASGNDVGCDECYLQLHNFVSEATMGLQPIFSLENAAGLVIAHGTIGRFLSNTANTNLFLSRDGGYTWSMILEGKYSFAVADHGGLILAIPIGRGKQDSVLFSWDMGGSWNSFKFVDNPVTVVRVLAKPGFKTRVFNVWGNDAGGHWTITTLDFTEYLGRPCLDADYNEWSPSDGRISNQRCVLGHKLVYKRRKSTSKCFNDIDYELEKSNTSCPCTKEDFECDYGFFRPTIDQHCVEYSSFNQTSVAPCSNGETSYFLSSGYRRVPGDTCSGGVQNQYLSTTTVSCEGDGSTPVAAIVIPVIMSILALVGIAIVSYVYNRKKNYWRARYMALAQQDHDDDIVHTGLDSGSELEDSEDDELEVSGAVVGENKSMR